MFEERFKRLASDEIFFAHLDDHVTSLSRGKYEKYFLFILSLGNFFQLQR